MPITNSAQNSCCKYGKTPSRGAGAGRIFFMGNPPASIDNKYVPGSGVGATSTSNRRALMRRASFCTYACKSSKLL